MADADCEDNNACTDDTCVSGQCRQFTNTNDCEDGLFCTVNDHCIGGNCVSGGDQCTGPCDETANVCVECLTAIDCGDDGNVCTDAVCVKGVCQNVDITASCDDGLNCTIQDQCANGSCTGISQDCEDGFACTIDACEEPGGCVHMPNDNACNDGNECTDDSCDSLTGCVFVSDDTNTCDDGNACNGVEACSAGECLEGTPLVCDDENSCTDDSCDPMTGCVLINDDTNTCDDACTLNDTCSGGNCQGVPVDCTSAGDPCNTAECNPAGAQGNCDILTPIPDVPGCEP